MNEHFLNLRLSKHKGLKECDIFDLGQINVFCGKNNSGKTAILETIRNEKLHRNGIKFCDFRTDLFVADLTPRISTPVTRDHETIRKVIDAIEKHKEDLGNELFFYNDHKKFYEFLNKRLHDIRFFRKYITEESIVNAYHSIFPKVDPKIIYIPAKRHEYFGAKILSSDSLSLDPNQMLNFLFSCKNAEENSTKYKSFRELQKIYREISEGYKFDIIQENLGLKLVYKDRKHRNWINSNACGLGLTDLFLFTTFAYLSDYDILLIEEPENHLHPIIQRNLLKYFKEIQDKQLFVATHSNVFLDTNLVDAVFFTEYKNGIKIENETSRARILSNIGYSVNDNLTSDLIILTEGPTDNPVLIKFMMDMGFYHEYNIKIWPLGGDIMDQLDLDVITENRDAIALIDSDPQSRKVRNRFKKICKEKSIPCIQLKRYSIENYFTLSALRKVFGNQIKKRLKEINPKIKLKDQIGIDVKKNNINIVQHMSLNDIENTDLFDFLKLVESSLKKH